MTQGLSKLGKCFTAELCPISAGRFSKALQRPLPESLSLSVSLLKNLAHCTVPKAFGSRAWQYCPVISAT